ESLRALACRRRKGQSWRHRRRQRRRSGNEGPAARPAARDLGGCSLRSQLPCAARSQGPPRKLATLLRRYAQTVSASQMTKRAALAALPPAPLRASPPTPPPRPRPPLDV